MSTCMSTSRSNYTDMSIWKKHADHSTTPPQFFCSWMCNVVFWLGVWKYSFSKSGCRPGDFGKFKKFRLENQGGKPVDFLEPVEYTSLTGPMSCRWESVKSSPVNDGLEGRSRYTFWGKSEFGITVKLILSTYILERTGLCNISSENGTLKNKSTSTKSWTWQKSIVGLSSKSSQKKEKSLMKSIKVVSGHKLTMLRNVVQWQDWLKSFSFYRVHWKIIHGVEDLWKSLLAILLVLLSIW